MLATYLYQLEPTCNDSSGILLLSELARVPPAIIELKSLGNIENMLCCRVSLGLFPKQPAVMLEGWLASQLGT